MRNLIKYLLIGIISALLFMINAETFAQEKDSLFLSSESSGGVNETGSPVELGFVFQATAAGYITHIKFYKTSAADTGMFTLNIWSLSGSLIHSQPYKAPGKSGWQNVLLDHKILIEAFKNYVVSFHSPQGRYRSKTGVFSTQRIRGNLLAPSNDAVSGNGRYIYSYSSSFPVNSWSDAWYCIDIVYKKYPPLIVNAGSDTTYLSEVDSNTLKDITLNGSVAGEVFSYTWYKEGPLGLGDTIIGEKTLTPIVKGLALTDHSFILKATDILGNTSESRVIISGRKNPLSTVIRILQNGTWIFEGSKKPGFEPEEEP
jgi:hypothetical protein